MESNRAIRKKGLRKKLLAFASVNAKKNGLTSLTVDKLMRGVGRTGSVFYTVFPSKNDMVDALIQEELDRSEAMLIGGWDGMYSPHREKHQSNGSSDDSSLEAWLANVLHPYLSMEHVADAEGGCVLPILSVDVAREGPALRGKFASVFYRIVSEWSARCGCSAEVAIALLAQCVGAVMLARAMDTENARVTLLQAASAMVSEMLEKTAKARGRTSTSGS